MTRFKVLDSAQKTRFKANPLPLCGTAPRPIKSGHIVTDQLGRFFLVLAASQQSLVIRELRRKVHDHTGAYAGFRFGHVGPDRSAFMPGSMPYRTRSRTLKRWPGGRIHAVWIEGIEPETASPIELETIDVPYVEPAIRRSRIPFLRPDETVLPFLVAAEPLEAAA
jgi:hypothetical protein